MICQICGKELQKTGMASHIVKHHKITIKQYYDTYLRKPGEGICPVCGKETTLLGLSRYRKYCSTKCQSNDPYVKSKRRETNLKKYGVICALNLDEVKQRAKENNHTEISKQKSKQTCLERYGVEYPNQSKVVRDKTKQTCLERYGVEHTLQVSSIRDKIKATNLKKYGAENPYQSEQIKDKIKNTWLDKYGVDNPNKTKEVRDKIKATNLKRYGTTDPRQDKNVQAKSKQTCLDNFGYEHPNQCPDIMQKVIDKKEALKHNIEISKNCTFINKLFDKYGYGWYESPLSKLCFKQNGFLFVHNEDIDEIELYKKCNGSYTEYYTYKFLIEHHIEFTHHNRQLIAPYELDFFLPTYNIGIECNGYYHNTNCYINRDQDSYHKLKVDLCNAAGIKLLFVTEENLKNIGKDLIL